MGSKSNKSKLCVAKHHGVRGHKPNLDFGLEQVCGAEMNVTENDGEKVFRNSIGMSYLHLTPGQELGVEFDEDEEGARDRGARDEGAWGE